MKVTLASLCICGVVLRLLMVSARGATGHLLSGLHLGLVTDCEPLHVDQKLWPTLFEGGIVEVVQVAASVLEGPVINLPEAVEVELPDEAGEVGGLEEFGVLSDRRQQLILEPLLVDNYALAIRAPEDRVVLGTVYQTPQLSREVIVVHVDFEKRLVKLLIHHDQIKQSTIE